MQDYLLCGFDFVVAPLAHRDHQQPLLQQPATAVVEAAPREELMLTSAQWGGQVRHDQVTRIQLQHECLHMICHAYQS